MDTLQASAREDKVYRIFIVIGIIIVAFNLRPAITSIGPLIGVIRDDVGLSNWSVGLLTSLPLIAFAVMSPIAPRLGNRLTNERALLLGLVFLFVGICIRSISVMVLLFVGTLLVGLGIAICNVLLPGVVKENFPLKVGLMTSVYSTAMGIFAAGASGLSVPLASGINLGWQKALLVWSIPTIIGIILWSYLANRRKVDLNNGMKYIHTRNNRMWHSPLAWQVAAYMGLQSFLFYVTISWLPEILHDYGVSMETAGWMLSFTQFVGLPASFLVPIIAGRLASQRGIVLTMGAFAISGYAGLLLGSSYTIMIISTILIGFALSGSFALALAFLAMRARDAKQAAELSGMAQSFGYILAAIGPMLIGYLYDLTHMWMVPLVSLIIVSFMVVLFGLRAGRNRYVL
ncbi:CynX/NimT family MFS transporter [Ornithinibacillus salinisoli]|uniref:CynX/NimT family MFS transporter n=1 Tax=Ornithinibacillus salinisoli TaxID=1848459 RepID=A0ABW4W2M1_9BACI